MVVGNEHQTSSPESIDQPYRKKNSTHLNFLQLRLLPIDDFLSGVKNILHNGDYLNVCPNRIRGACHSTESSVELTATSVDRRVKRWQTSRLLGSRSFSSESNNKNEESAQQKSTNSKLHEQSADFCVLCNVNTNEDLQSYAVHTHNAFRTLHILERDEHHCVNYQSAQPADMVFYDMHSYHCHLCSESCNNGGVSLLRHFQKEYLNAELPVEESETQQSPKKL
ncbi:hypothetical protein M3Y98_00081100 [Aphelenchoides besseyi]|nr:hypothetical protein M3Y98_00081100 [Aphelenchoides besseyi]